MTHPLFRKDIFVETAFEKRFQQMLHAAWHNHSWHVIVADPGAGKTMRIRDLLKTAGSRTVLAVVAPKNNEDEQTLGDQFFTALGIPLRGHWRTRKPKLMGHLHQYGTECLIVDDAHDLSLEHLMLLKEVTDQGRLQYDHPLGLCLVAAGRGDTIPLKETYDLPDPTWLQFRRRFDKLAPFCRIASHTSEEVRAILATLETVYQQLFPQLNHEEGRGAGRAYRLDATTPDVGFFASLSSLRTRFAFGRRLPDKGLLMSTSQDLMRGRINRQDGLQEQATTAIIADRSQTGCLGMRSVIEVRGILHQQDHRQRLHLAARLLIVGLHQFLKGDIGLIEQTIHCLDLFPPLHLGGPRGRRVFCHVGSRCHCPSRPTHILQQNTAKGRFCPALRVQQILCVHFLILPNYLCKMWVQVRAEAQGFTARYDKSEQLLRPLRIAAPPF